MPAIRGGGYGKLKLPLLGAVYISTGKLKLPIRMKRVARDV